MVAPRIKGSTIILVAVLVIVGFAMIFPMLALLGASFKSHTLVFTGGIIPQHFTLKNYALIFSSGIPLIRWIANSIGVSVSVSVLVVIVDSMAAFSLAKLKFRGRQVVFYVVVASLMVPAVATIIPLYLEFSLANLLNTYWALILPYTANAFGVFLLYQFYLAIPDELMDAARSDGASKFRMWRSIFVPLSIPALMTLALLTFMNVYNDFFWPLIATNSPSMRTVTVGVALTAVGQYSTNYAELMGLTFCSIVPMLLAFIFAQRQLTQGIATTGLNL